MLPSKYFADAGSEPRRRRTKDERQPPPLGITGVLCKSSKLRIAGRGQLSYTVYRPRMLETSKSTSLPPGLIIPPPLVCVAGGPGMSCTYLSVIVHGVTDRAIVLYDHMGTGQSVAESSSNSSLDDAISDLGVLLQHLFVGKDGKHRPFHLLGHSYGGIVAYEYLRRQSSTAISSLILSNVPYDVSATLERRTELREELGALDFMHTHECRAVPMPLPLQQSLESLVANSSSRDTTYRTHTVAGTSIDVPTLLLFAQYDFVQPDERWKSACPNATIVHLADVSHYAMIENDALYNATIARFLVKD